MSCANTITAEYALADWGMESFKQIGNDEFNEIIDLSNKYNDITNEQPPVLDDTCTAATEKTKKIELLALRYEPLYRRAIRDYDNFMAQNHEIFSKDPPEGDETTFLKNSLRRYDEYEIPRIQKKQYARPAEKQPTEYAGMRFFDNIVLTLDRYERNKKQYAAIYAKREQLQQAIQKYAPYATENIRDTIRAQHAIDWRENQQKRMQEVYNKLNNLVHGFEYIVKDLSVCTTDSVCRIKCCYMHKSDLFAPFFYDMLINSKIEFARGRA